MHSGRTADTFPAGDKVAVCLSPRRMYFLYKISIRPLESAGPWWFPGQDVRVLLLGAVLPAGR